MPIREIDKVVGAWCQHARPGRGCAIHGQHPDSCRTFVCEWLARPEVPIELQPGRTKVVLTAVAGSNETQLVAYCDPADPLAWRREPMHAFLKRQTAVAGRIRPVIIWAGKRMWLLTPDAEHDLGEVKGAQSFRIEPGPDGKPTVRLVSGDLG
jgi:hypothetical protein